MLELLRKKKVQRRILVVLAAIIIPAFVLWGSGNLGEKRIAGSSFVGTVGTRKIGIEDFYQARRGTQIQLILSYLGQQEVLDTVMKDRNLMNKLTWDRIVMIKEAEKRGIKVSDEEVVRFITTHPLFIHNGVFDNKFYDYMVTKSLGLSTRTFEEEIRRFLQIARLKDLILKDVFIADDEAINAYKRDFEKIKISYIRINQEEFKDTVDVSENDIDTYYTTREAEFIVPYTLNIEYMEFPYENMAEKDVLMRNVNMFYKIIRKNPEKFSDIAKENNREIKETGEFFRNDPPAVFAFDIEAFDDLFNKDIGSVEVLFSEAAAGSIYIVKIKEKTASKLKPKEEVSSIIADNIKGEKAWELAKAKADEVYKAIQAEGLPLEDASFKFELKLSKTDFITRFGYVDGVGEAYEILDEISNSRPGAALAPFETRKGYVIVRLDVFQGIDEEKFEKEKENYKNKVLAAKKTKALTEWFAGISQNARLAIDLKHL